MSSKMSSQQSYFRTPYVPIWFTGADTLSFLQGLVTRDLTELSERSAAYSLLLSPQSRYLFDMFIVQTGTQLLVLVLAERYPAFLTLLSSYRLRAAVEWVVSDADICLAIPDHTWKHCQYELKAQKITLKLIFSDPRIPHFMHYILISHTDAERLHHHIRPLEALKRYEYAHGLPCEGADKLVDKTVPFDVNLDLLSAFSWGKGCYPGQQLITRTKHTGVVHRRLFPALLLTGEAEGVMPSHVVEFQGQPIGKVMSSLGRIVHLKLDVNALSRILASKNPVQCGSQQYMPYVPHWLGARLQESTVTA